MSQASLTSADATPGDRSAHQNLHHNVEGAHTKPTTTRELRRKLRTGALTPTSSTAVAPSAPVRTLKRPPSPNRHIFWTVVFVLTMNLVTAFGIAVAAGPGRLKATLLAGVPYMVVATVLVCALSASAWVQRNHESD